MDDFTRAAQCDPRKFSPDAAPVVGAMWGELCLGNGGLAVQCAATLLNRVEVRDAATWDAVVAGFFGLRQCGRTDDAVAFLAKWGRRTGTEPWNVAVVRYLQNASTANELIAAADAARMSNGAHALIGIMLALEGKRNAAIEHLQLVEDRSSGQFAYHLLASEMLRELKAARRQTQEPRQSAGR